MEKIKAFPSQERTLFEKLQNAFHLEDNEISLVRKRQPWKQTAAYEMVGIRKENGNYSVVYGIGYHSTTTAEGYFDHSPVKRVKQFNRKPTRNDVEKLLVDLAGDCDLPL